MLSNRAAGLVFALIALSVPVVSAQSTLVDVVTRHGVEVKGGSLDVAFDAGLEPTVAVTPGSFATPLAVLTTTTGSERIAGAYAFGILAGRSGRAASAPELAAAGQALVVMIGSTDRRSRVAGARVAGRLFAAPFDTASLRPVVPAGLSEGAFALLNQGAEIEQLAAMDTLGLLRDVNAVTSLTERFHFYRDGGKRALAGGALEALARIGHSSSATLVKALAADRWTEGKDATALAVAFARERLLKDGSIATIRQAVDDKSRRNQARGYLAELGAPAP
jgi:hypothetical protein